MVVLGVRNQGQSRIFLLQNWWREKQYMEVSESYLDFMDCSMCFVSTPQIFDRDNLPSYADKFASNEMVDCQEAYPRLMTGESTLRWRFMIFNFNEARVDGTSRKRVFALQVCFSGVVFDQTLLSAEAFMEAAPSSIPCLRPYQFLPSFHPRSPCCTLIFLGAFGRAYAKRYQNGSRFAKRSTSARQAPTASTASTAAQSTGSPCAWAARRRRGRRAQCQQGGRLLRRRA